jgi:hypothetical protein
MDIVSLTLFSLWLATTAFVAVVAVVAGGWFLGRARRAPRQALSLAVTCLAVALLAAATNPIVNWRLFHPRREYVMAAMRAEVGQPVAAVVEKYGEPHAVSPGADGETWRYRPGPWYVLLQWEEVVYQVRGGQIQAAYIDD